jgi:hypothetical protein
MTERLPSIELIKRAVAEHFGTTVAAIEGPSRKHPLVHQRQIAHYIALGRSKHSENRIGRCFNRDHVTMRWSRYQVGQRLYRDDKLVADIAAIEARIEAAQNGLVSSLHRSDQHLDRPGPAIRAFRGRRDTALVLGE